jgi:hypothetical protein
VLFSSYESTEQGKSNCTSSRADGGVEGTQTPRVKAANGRNAVRKAYGSLVGDGAGKRVMKCVMCTDNDKEGSG